MAGLVDRIVVVDVESTCWQGDAPPGQTSDIIEIGLALVDARALDVSAKTSILVKPERSAVSAFCTRLTTLTQEQVDRGVSLAEACARLRKDFETQDRPWASYGDYDRRMFENCCSSLGVQYPFGHTHLNVKNLFAIALAHRSEVSLSTALKNLGLPQEGTLHRGHDDAWNIAHILAAILRAARANHLGLSSAAVYHAAAAGGRVRLVRKLLG